MYKIVNKLVVGLSLLLMLSTSFALTNSNDKLKYQNLRILSQLQAAFIKDPIISPLNIHLSVDNGFVRLIGKVDTVTEFERVVTIAESINGVADVETTLLKVKSSNKPLNDALITAKVKGMFMREALLNNTIKATALNVETKNGVVYLTGNVADSQDKQKVVKLAQSVAGVTLVKNDLG